MEPKFSAVLFDCDGVLVDSESITNSVLRQMLIELGWDISAEECIRIFIGKALKDQWEPILEHTGVRIDEAWIASFRARRDTALRTDLQPITGAVKAVKAIHELYGENIACVTGADRAKVEMQLEIAGLSKYFGDRVFSGMECAKSKPAPDVYLTAAASLGIDPEKALVIEDTATGATAGIGAGATVFGFSNNGPTSTAPQKLLDAGAAHVFNDMAELPDLASH
ncbi:haloacid dehalogenase [Glutamicibacter uratoxydans]|uniref:Haloacid dehalogenase n=1 Tax=Glutamicibacter uratoxydans TaxID=43667 RepID=A0A4Y4DQL8_GLUUR|nr:HAD family phosphatase [Glutamicibacter uratoxydans]GED06907.1 haloacid dehalogenase [Glutamicibacter uratoxydans]